MHLVLVLGKRNACNVVISAGCHVLTDTTPTIVGLAIARPRCNRRCKATPTLCG